MKPLKLILSKKDWMNVTFNNFLVKGNPKNFTTESFQKKCEAKNKEIDDFLDFYKNIAYTNDDNTLFEFNSKYLNQQLLESLTEKNNKKLLYNLFKNNNRKYYFYEIVNSNMKFSNLNDEIYFNMFRHIIQLVNPFLFQSEIEYIQEQYDKDIDTETIQYDFHKSLRQAEIFQNAHLEMMLWNILQLSDVPHKAIREITKDSISQKIL